MSDPIERIVEDLVEQLLRGGARTITLDEIGDAIGELPFGAAEVELLMTRLEQEGVTIVEAGGEGLVSLLRRVISTAHELRGEGVTPSPADIAERSGLSVRAIRVALLYADVLKG